MNPYFLLGAVLAVAFAGGAGYSKGYSSGKAVVQQQWDKATAMQAEQYAKDQEEARKKEQALQANADKLREDKDREIKNINARAVALSNSLQYRPTRDESQGGVSNAANACSGASGAQLARGDGEFLAGYAADAAKLNAALTQCVQQYNAAKTK